MRYVLIVVAIFAAVVLLWPADDHAPLVNRFDACTMARSWHDVARTGEAWADVVSMCGLHK